MEEKQHSNDEYASNINTSLSLSSSDQIAVSHESLACKTRKWIIRLFGKFIKTHYSSPKEVGKRPEENLECQNQEKAKKRERVESLLGRQDSIMENIECQNQEKAKKRDRVESLLGLQDSIIAVGSMRDDAKELLGSQDSYVPLEMRGLSPKHNENKEVIVRKVLTTSDINDSSRLLLGKKEADQILPSMNLTADEIVKGDEKGVEVKIFDVDTNEFETTLRLKRWATNSLIFNNGWTKSFVMRRKLRKGDEIALAWDQTNQRLNFSVTKKGFPLGASTKLE